MTIRNRNVVRDSDGNLIAMARNMAVVIIDADENERAVHRVAVCSQEWQPADVPPEARYHLMWRAVAPAQFQAEWEQLQLVRSLPRL